MLSYPWPVVVFVCVCANSVFVCTRSYAALRAADLDWIVGPWEGGGAGISKNVTEGGSQLTF